MAQRACEGVFLQICNMAQTVRSEFILQIRQMAQLARG